MTYQKNGPIWLDATQKIIGGMSGSPILADDGTAIGVVSCSGGLEENEGGPNRNSFDEIASSHCLPRGLGPRQLCDYSRDSRPAEWAPTVILRGNNPQDRMSAWGGDLNWSTQHFILNEKDGVCGDRSRISSRFYCGGENGVMGSLAAGGVAESDWTGVR